MLPFGKPGKQNSPSQVERFPLCRALLAMPYPHKSPFYHIQHHPGHGEQERRISIDQCEGMRYMVLEPSVFTAAMNYNRTFLYLC